MSSTLADKIWFTAKARMRAEKRYKLYDVSAHLIMTYMSLLMIIVSIFALKFRSQVEHFDDIRLCISISLLASSLIIYGFRFAETANKYRECYLKLDALFNQLTIVSTMSAADASKKYEEILALHPNHADRDHEYVILSRTLLSSEKLSVGGKPVEWTLWMLARQLGRYVVFSIVVFGPVVLSIKFVLSPMLLPK